MREALTLMLWKYKKEFCLEHDNDYSDVEEAWSDFEVEVNQILKILLQQINGCTKSRKEINIIEENFPSCFVPDSSFDIFSEFKDKISHEGYELKFR